MTSLIPSWLCHSPPPTGLPEETLARFMKQVDKFKDNKPADALTESLRNELAKYRRVYREYTLIVRKCSSQIRMVFGLNNILFKWTFVPELFSQYQKDLHLPIYEKIYGVSKDGKEITTALDVLETIMQLFPGDVRTIIINSGVLELENKLRFLQFASFVKHCEVLCINGEGPYEPEFCSRFLNEIKVTKRLFIKNFPADSTVSFDKIRVIPKVEYHLLTATAQDIIDSASKLTVIQLLRFSIKEINQLMHLWLNSSITHISTLILKINITEKENIEHFFDGLKQYNSTKGPCCGFFTTCSKDKCISSKFQHLQVTGVSLIRSSDKAEATVFYAQHLREFSFCMIVNPQPKMREERFYNANTDFEIAARDHNKITKPYQELLANITRNNNILAGKPFEKKRRVTVLRLYYESLNLSYFNLHCDMMHEWKTQIKKMEKAVPERGEERDRFGYFSIPLPETRDKTYANIEDTDSEDTESD